MESPVSIAPLLVYHDDEAPEIDVKKVFEVQKQIKSGSYAPNAERILKEMFKQHCETLPKLSTISVDKIGI